MTVPNSLSRRGFVGGVATALGTLTLSPRTARAAQVLMRQGAGVVDRPFAADDYDSYAKLAANENPYGPPESVMNAMTTAFKYSNRYNYPDGNLVAEIAKLHNVAPEYIMLGAGSGEILSVTALALLEGGKKVVGVDPTFMTVYQYASGAKADSIRLPLRSDYGQDIPQMIAAVKHNYRDVGLVYLCNPNNPTGRIVTSAEVKQLLDGIPEDVPVLIDEAYHHFVNDAAYSTSVPYVMQGRPVIVARTFSKIAALAGMRLGYAVASPEMLARLKPHSYASINALAKWGGVAALKDTENQARVKAVTIELRDKTTSELASRGYEVIPSQANFFMVGIKRPVQPVIDAFKTRGVLVGRPFPPMTQHLRVSVGTPVEMQRFMTGFGEIFSSPPKATGSDGKR
ncbi:MAG: aminotransferase class I/II-fold pyridoxal phosphate-dependent enzyme [Gemmatimonadota bacterium]|nr:aminotransferase class I/II-fold pyridoxal phosphate-dependent enzyme [Gemmatimonadota bacterium]